MWTCSPAPMVGSGAPITVTPGPVTPDAAIVVSPHDIHGSPPFAMYGGDANNAGSNSAPLSQVVNSGGGSVNVALASNGGVASASSTYVAPGYSFPVAAVNNGERAGLNWGNGGGWNDATGSASRSMSALL